MPQDETSELLRRVIEAFGEAGVEAALRHLHPEIVWHSPPEWLEQSVYRGREAVGGLATHWMTQFEDYTLDLDRVVEAPDGRAAALLYQRGRIKESGARVEQETVYLGSAREGMLDEVHVFFSWDDGLEAAGVQA